MFKPPWHSPEYPTPRADYLAGTWAYCIGKSGGTHPRYKEAIKKAKGFEWWVRNWGDVEAVLAGCRFNIKLADSVCAWLQMCRQYKGEWAGKPLVLADWQRYDVIMPLFGWLRPDGTRRFRRAYVEIAKKNGKSTLLSALALYMLIGDLEGGAEVYSAAVDRGQAAIIYQTAAHMVKQSPELSKRLNCIDSTKRIVHYETGSVYQALSAEVSSKEGLNIHAAIFDELHAYKNSKMWDTLKYGGAARRQPIQIAITTAGVYDPTALGWEQHEYALKVRDAELEAHKDWSQFVYIAGLNEEQAQDWTEPEMWKRANPSWGITIREDEMAELCQVACVQPSAQNDFKRYRLDIWTQQRSVWIDHHHWESLGADYGPDDLKGRVCYGGLDLSLTQDITACVLWFPPEREGGKHRFLEQFWIPEECVAKGDEIHNGLYSIWRNSGYIAVTPGNVVDYSAIKCYIVDQMRRFKIKTCSFDKWNSTQLVLELQHEGLEMLSISQGFAGMSDPTKRFGDLTASCLIQHRRNPVFSWMLGNSQLISDTNGNIRVIKGEARGPGKGKIRYKVDGVIAAIMALSGAMLDANKPSVYERRGLVVL